MFSESVTTPTPHRLTAISLVVSIAIAASACGNVEGQQPSNDTGTVQMALTAMGSDGDTYRLRQATLNIDGPTAADVLLDDAYGDAPVFAATVDVGSYAITLKEGWVLQRYDGETFVDVVATLLTPNPLDFSVERNATTIVGLVFETVDAEIEFATGDLEVWLAVNHLDCEHGEYVTRSCGANLIGRQFRMCNQGWWKDWSECSKRCDRGYCLFTDPETFSTATIDKTTEVVGFETYASGSPVPPESFVAHDGAAFSDNVSFISVGASNQMFPYGSGTPFVGQKHANIVIHGGDESGDAVIRSSAGGHNFSGFDALEAIFSTEEDVYAAAITVDDNDDGYTLSIHNAGCDVVSEIRVSSGDGHHFIVLGDATYKGIEAASSIVITPEATSSTPHGTSSWSLTEFAFAH